MAETKPPVQLELTWEQELVFSGRSGPTTMTLDSASVAGPSPMQALAYGLAGCMAIDVVHILKKGRQDLRGLHVRLTGVRADTEPRRFVSMDLHYAVTGHVAPDVVQRAVDLSREKYCSVWHSMRQDIELNITFSIDQ